MSKVMPESLSSPTMIIPSGTQIEVDAHGQLSISTPGNLVIQNSGSYGTIESSRGSIRIEANVQVEAVNIQCQETCYVQGSLTAWKVRAKAIQLEDTARAHIILQETDQLEVGREARLVGNFSSEKELFLLFSRFAKQLKSMPFFADRERQGELEGGVEGLAALGAGRSEEANGASPSEVNRKPAPAPSAAAARSELPETLFFAKILLEREVEKPGNGPTSKRVMEELVAMLSRRDTETLRHTHRDLFGRIVEPSQDVKRAQELISSFCGAAPESTAAATPIRGAARASGS